MALFKAGVIGCGGRGRGHAEGYQASPDVEIVACADPFEEARGNFAEQFGVPRTYEDYREMLEKESLDFVSVCTWIALHKEMVIAAANSGIKAIHAEKPMAPTWGDAKALYQACVDNDVMISFCHQRRFGASFIKAKELANDGTIGQVYRFEGACPNMIDWGTHWFDMFFFYNNDEPAEWVMGQIDVDEETLVFGVPVETSGVSWIRYKNGVEGLLATGAASLGGVQNRIIGTDGIIEVSGRDKPPVRVLRHGQVIGKHRTLTVLCRPVGIPSSPYLTLSIASKQGVSQSSVDERQSRRQNSSFRPTSQAAVVQRLPCRLMWTTLPY